MISKDQFLELKHLKSLGVPTTTIAKKIGISVLVGGIVVYILK